MAFKQRSVEIAPLTNGVTTVISDKADAKFKQLKNVEPDVTLGGLVARKGLEDITNDFYSFGSFPAKFINVSSKDKQILYDVSDRTVVVTDNGSAQYFREPLSEGGNTPWYQEAYGLSVVETAEYTYMVQLSTLLKDEATEGRGDIVYYDPTQGGRPLRVGIPTPPAITNVRYGNSIADNDPNEPILSLWVSLYTYSFVYKNGIESEIAEPVFVGSNGGRYEKLFHVQRRPENIIGATDLMDVDQINIYAVHVKSNYLLQFEGKTEKEALEYGLESGQLQYQKVQEVTGDDLDVREAGDPVSDNYVLITDDLGPWVVTDLINEPEVYVHRYGRSGRLVEGKPYITGQRVYYTPKGGYITLYNDRLMVIGDPTARKSLFFSEEHYQAFPADNSLVLPVVTGDDYLTGMAVLGNSLYVFSPHGTYRVTENSPSLPYYHVEEVQGMRGIGVIAPKTLVKVFGKLYFLSSEGIIEFNGTTFKIISTPIDFKNQIDEDASFLAVAYYNTANTSIYFGLPLNSTTDITKVYKYYLKQEEWLEVEFDELRTFVLNEKQNQELRIIRNDDTIMELSDTDKSGIDATIETYDIDFGEESIFNAIRLWGTGTIKLSCAVRRESTPSFNAYEIELSESGTDVYLNLQGRELRIMIEPVDSENFYLSKSPSVVYSNNGVKRMAEVK